MPSPSWRFVSMLFLAVLAPVLPDALASAACASPPVEEEVLTGEVREGALATKVDEYLSRLAGLGFAGGIVLEEGDQLVLARGYGLADRELARPFTTQTLFSTGSVTKPFTGVALAKLWELGDLDFDQPLGDFFDEVPADKEEITVHHLLTHGSGLPGAVGFDFAPCSREELVARAMAAPLEFEPGTGYTYSNVGFSVAAAILEIVSGQDYDAFLREHVLEPAGMQRTGYRLQRHPREEYSHGYRGDEHWGLFADKYWTEDGPSWHLVGNGALHTCLLDAYRFHRALLDDTLLSSEARAHMFSRHNPEGGEYFYGYGWSLTRTPSGGSVIRHNGGNPFISNDLVRFVDDGMMYYLHSNDGNWRAPEISEHLEAFLVGGVPLALPPRVVAQEEGQFTRLAGTYELAGGERLEVLPRGRGLELVPSGWLGYARLRGVGPEADEMLERACQDIVRKVEEARANPLQAASNPLPRLLRRLNRDGGALPEVQVLGAVPSAMAGAPEGTYRVRIRILGSMMGEHLDLAWNAGRIVGIDFRESVGELMAYPLGGENFQTFDLSDPNSVRLRFVLEGGREGTPALLELQSEDGKIEAHLLALENG